jgi:parallel beta-helix repeat protein
MRKREILALALSAVVIFGVLGAFVALRTSQTKQASVGDEGLAQIQRIVEQAKNGQIAWEQASAQIRSILGLDFGLGNIFENSPPVTVIEEGSGVEPASYIVFGVDTNGDNIADEIYAKSGDNGAIAFSGNNAAAVIQAAINALPNGGKVLIKRGIYSITASINLASNIALVGEGPGTVLRIPDGFNADLNVIYGSNVSRVLVANLKIDGNKANNSSGTMHGIYLSSVTYSEVRGCWVENMWSYGIYLRSSSNNNIISGNIVQGSGSYGIRISSSSNNTVTGNIVQGNGSYGIYLDSSSNNNTVAGNTVQGNGSYGIRIYSSNNNTVVGNTVQGNDDRGIVLHYSNNNTVTGNTVQGNNYYGIHLNASNNNTVVGNTVQGNSFHGIYIYYSNNNTVVGNSVLGNSQATDNYYDGICVNYNSSNNFISGNVVRHQGLTNQHRYGINVNSSDCYGNFIHGNDLYQAGKTGDYNDAGTGTIYHNNRTSEGWVA